jgi:hypothetical protein
MGADASERTMSETAMSSSLRERESTHSLAGGLAMHATTDESFLLPHG